MKSGTPRNALVALLLGFALFRLATCFRATPVPGEVYDLYRGLANLAAVETARVLDGKGRVVLVMDEARNPHLRLREKEFARAASALGLTLVAVRRAGPKDSHPESGISAGFYRQLLDQHGDVDAIVSFAGSPPKPKASETPSFAGAFIAVLPHEQTLPDLLSGGWVRMALVPAGPPRNFRVVEAESGEGDEGEPPEIEIIDEHLTPIPPRN